MAGVFKQASGARSTLAIFKEASYGVPPETLVGIRLPFNTHDVSPKQDMKQAGTQYEGPDPLEPLPSFVKLDGSLNVPVDGVALGHLLAAIMGEPDSADLSPITLVNAEVVDRSGGLVGIPAVGHGLEPGMSILLDGTANYDGKYELEQATTEDELVIKHAYEAEVIANATVFLGGDSLEGLSVVNKGGGKVGIPLPRHGYVPGDRVTVDGSASYDATFTVLDGTSVGQIVVSNAYVAETFGSGVTVRPALRRHKFILKEDIPSYILEAAHADVDFYEQSHGAMFGSLGLRLGGDGELVAAFNVSASRDEISAAPLSENVTKVGMARFTFDSVKLLAEGGIASRIVKNFEVNISRNLDTETGYVVGGGANLAIITAGKASVGGRVEALFTKEEGPVMVGKSRSGERTDFKVVFCRPHEFMIWNHPAAKLGRAGVPVPSQRGLTASFTWQGYKDTYSTGSAVEYDLINTVQNY